MLPQYYQPIFGNAREPTVMREAVSPLQPLIETPLAAGASVFSESPRTVQASVMIEAPLQQPVETLEQRGDAMLFEIDALQGTPFDTAVVKPFD